MINEYSSSTALDECLTPELRVCHVLRIFALDEIPCLHTDFAEPRQNREASIVRYLLVESPFGQYNCVNVFGLLQKQKFARFAVALQYAMPTLARSRLRSGAVHRTQSHPR